jgi:hypothetical protein
MKTPVIQRHAELLNHVGLDNFQPVRQRVGARPGTNQESG